MTGLLNMMQLQSIHEPLGGVAVAVGFYPDRRRRTMDYHGRGHPAVIQNRKVLFVPQDNSGWEFYFLNWAVCIAVLFPGSRSIALDRGRFGIGG